MKKLLGPLFGVGLLLQSFKGDAQPIAVSLTIQPGSYFSPVGADPLPLNGALEFGSGFLIYDDIAGQNLLAQKLTRLHFTAGFLQFQLHEPAAFFNGAVAVPGPRGPISSFQATVDMLDVHGDIIESGLRTFGFSSRATPNEGMTFSSIPLYRNPDSETPELVGTFSFTATAVPEPIPIALFSVLATLGTMMRRRWKVQ